MPRCLFLLLLAAPLLAAPVPKGLKAKPAEWMPVVVGTKWVYCAADDPTAILDEREITDAEEKDGEVTATQKTSNLTQTFRRSADGTSVTLINNQAEAKPRFITKAGMKEGDTWDNDMGGYTETRVVGAAETLKLPAGEFEAVPVKFTYVQNGRTFQSGTVWYAPNVGLVRIDTDGQTTQVLKAFTPGK
jgi:hypothetical protein